MTSATKTPAMNRVGQYLRDNPVIPLIVFLCLLIALLEIMRPGIVMPIRSGREGLISTFWLGNLIKFAIPLAMLAACIGATTLFTARGMAWFRRGTQARRLLSGAHTGASIQAWGEWASSRQSLSGRGVRTPDSISRISMIDWPSLVIRRSSGAVARAIRRSSGDTAKEVT